LLANLIRLIGAESAPCPILKNLFLFHSHLLSQVLFEGDMLPTKEEFKKKKSNLLVLFDFREMSSNGKNKKKLRYLRDSI
jgi:hypothetical protein